MEEGGERGKKNFGEIEEKLGSLLHFFGDPSLC